MFQKLPPKVFAMVSHALDEFEENSRRKTNKKYTKEQFEAGMQTDVSACIHGECLGASCTVESHLSEPQIPKHVS